MPAGRRTPRRRGAATLLRLERASGALVTSAVNRMDAELPWFRAMPAEQRSWVGLVAHAGIASFLEWLRTPAGDAAEISGEIFAAAPRELTRAITLQQTVELVRLTIDVVESQVDSLAAPGEEALLYEAVIRYSREVAFAAAEVYAGAAEQRGAWDARLEALVVDALLRGESDDALRSRAAALGWGTPTHVCVLAGAPAPGDPDGVLDRLREQARRHSLDVLSAVHGHRLVVVLGSAEPPETAVRPLLVGFDSGPVVLGPSAADITGAAHSARVALAGLRAVAARPDAPRPVPADELLPERALAGDEEARRVLVEEIYSPLAKAGGSLLETVDTYVQCAGSLEATARRLFVHANTVRYRLRKATEACHFAATDPRDGFTLRVAIMLGRLESETAAL